MKLRIAKYKATEQVGEQDDGGVANDIIRDKDSKNAANANLKQKMRGWCGLGGLPRLFFG